MNRPVSVILWALLSAGIIYAQSSRYTALDSIHLTAGNWLMADIQSHDRKAVYLSDGRIVMYRVIAEIRTRKDSLATSFKMMFPKSVVAGGNGDWTLQPDTACIETLEPRTNRLIAGASGFVNITSTRAGAIEALLHFDTGFAPWLFLEIGGSYGRTSSDGSREIVGPVGVFRSTIDYEGFLLFVGLGVQYGIGSGRLELAGEVGQRSLSSSLASNGGNTASFAQVSSEVACTAFRYVHAFSGSPVFLAVGIRYWIANIAIDSEKQRFAYVVGVGFRL
jgi:hypothetical protein